MFPKSNVQPIVESVCNKLLQDKSFDQVIQLHVNDQIANEINTQLAQFTNYKWIVHVNTQQLATMLMTSQTIWDADKDGMVEYVYKTNDYVLGVVVYGCYFK